MILDSLIHFIMYSKTKYREIEDRIFRNVSVKFAKPDTRDWKTTTTDRIVHWTIALLPRL